MPASRVIQHSQARILIEETQDGRRRIVVSLHDRARFSPRLEWTTSYPPDLIEAILRVKHPAYLCDEIARDEEPEYVQVDVEAALFSYVPREHLEGKRVLDFGCGTGASTVILGRLCPGAEIIGVDLADSQLDIARLRAQHHGAKNTRFVTSPRPDQLPAGIGRFDFILLSAVYEHLLPAERPPLLSQMWDRLIEGGVLFLNQTPDRRFPIETHTSSLPLINYLPDGLAQRMARRFSRRVERDASWEELLRLGLRGGTPREIKRILRLAGARAQFLTPHAPGIHRQSDIWYRSARARLHRKFRGPRRALIFASIGLLTWLAVPIAPYLSLAIRKQETPGEPAADERR